MSVDLQAFARYRTAATSNCSSLAAHDRIDTLERVCELGVVGNAPEDRCGIDRVSAMVGNPVCFCPSFFVTNRP
jgi:hypothetical protein